MAQYTEVLKNVDLFKDIAVADIPTMLSCLDAKTVSLKKGEYLFHEGSTVDFVGILLQGELQIQKEDINGERSLIAGLKQGEIFAEALCCSCISESPVSVVATTDGEVMLIWFCRVLETCGNHCSFHKQLIANMLKLLAQKNLQLQVRMDFLSRKTIRRRLLSYLEALALKQGQSFTLPLNRQELADFLCIDRSALSRELSNMKNEGLLDFHKNHFHLY